MAEPLDILLNELAFAKIILFYFNARLVRFLFKARVCGR